MTAASFPRPCPSWCTSPHDQDTSWCCHHRTTVGTHRLEETAYDYISVWISQVETRTEVEAPLVMLLSDTGVSTGHCELAALPPMEAVGVAHAFEVLGHGDVAELLRTAVRVATGELAEVAK